jgi:hypothetical protein
VCVRIEANAKVQALFGAVKETAPFFGNAFGTERIGVGVIDNA